MSEEHAVGVMDGEEGESPHVPQPKLHSKTQDVRGVARLEGREVLRGKRNVPCPDMTVREVLKLKGKAL